MYKRQVEARFLGETGLLSQSDDGSRAFAERWLRTWAKTGSGVTDLARLDQRIGRDQDWQRGQAYLALRLRGPALEALELVRTRYWNDPLLVYQLALAFEELGTYRLSVISAARVIALAPGKSVSDTPIFIQRLAYPQHFADLVAEEATRFAVDPLLVYAMIRQESLFEPGAESSAAARGLMQVIPSTGRWIAGELGMLDFQESDLYRPWISVKFGVFYTIRGLRAANGNAGMTRILAGTGRATMTSHRGCAHGNAVPAPARPSASISPRCPGFSPPACPWPGCWRWACCWGWCGGYRGASRRSRQPKRPG